MEKENLKYETIIKYRKPRHFDAAIDKNGDISGAVTTSGTWVTKMAGRVGDSQ